MTQTFITVTPSIIRADDLQAHIEDERIYSAIRGGKLISNLTWNELTEAEQYEARYNFCSNEYYY